MARKGGAPAEDLSNVEFETSEDVEVIPSFNAMGLKEELLRGIYAYGKYNKKKLLKNNTKLYYTFLYF